MTDDQESPGEAKAPAVPQVRLLAAAVLLALVVRFYITEIGGTWARGGAPWPTTSWGAIALVVVAVVVSAAAALVGRRLLNSVAAVLLGAVGGGLATGMYNAVPGMLLGFVVGLLVALDIARRVWKEDDWG